jgi:hypothetical protein
MAGNLSGMGRAQVRFVRVVSGSFFNILILRMDLAAAALIRLQRNL